MGRLKLNGRLRGYSPLSRLLEIEGLIAGIDAKRSLWRSLRAVAPDDRIDETDLGTLAERADQQRARLLPHHDAAAREALGQPRSPSR